MSQPTRKELAVRTRYSCLMLISCAVTLGVIVFNPRLWTIHRSGWEWAAIGIGVAGFVIAMALVAGQTIQMARLLRASAPKP